MTDRRARGSSPTGRGDRRSSRTSRPRPERSGNGSAPAARTAAGKRAAQRRAGGRSDAASAARKTDRSERKILGLPTGRAVILAAVLCALALTLAVPMRTYFSQRAEATNLAQQRRELEDDLARLRDRRAQQQDPAYIRSEARDRLRLVMPGETAYIVQVPGIEQPAVPAQTTKPRPPDPWYTQLWHSVANPPAPEHTTPPPPPPNPEGAPR
ncbi:FtsB family cell division protein [Nocardia terpenica]|uniref:FtsB family cell division protein n=1 Tax=Nocardia terpenica TaxID=455432 RepID=UPI00155A0234|nr:septum formation initiator family protein [Nocardia terpenica]NQE90341.1 septum formation initiator family protein [Nocardia terpenica]